MAYEAVEPTYIPWVFIPYLLFVPRHAQIYIKILDYITNAATCFGASALSSESFDIPFAEVI